MVRRYHRLVGLLALCGGAMLVASSVSAQRVPPDRQHDTIRDGLFVGAITVSAAANSVLRYHHAAGARRPVADPNDRWLGRDKALHGGASYALTLAGIGGGVRPWVAALGVCAAGAVFERTQVAFSRKDVAVNCASAAVAWGTSKLFPRRRAAEE